MLATQQFPNLRTNRNDKNDDSKTHSRCCGVHGANAEIIGATFTCFEGFLNSANGDSNDLVRS